MASRYWVGGTASWNGTPGTKWATTSGGAGGAAEPTGSDDVFLDANSGAVTVTIATSVATCASLTCTGFTGTLSQGKNLNIGSASAGNLILSSAMTFTQTAGTLKVTTSQAGNTLIDTQGKDVKSFLFNGVGATFVLQSNFLSSADVTFQQGTVDMNGFNLKGATFDLSSVTTRTVNLRGGTLEVSGTGAVWNTPGGTLTLSSSGGKIYLSDTSASVKTFAGGTITYPKIHVAGAASAGSVTFSGAFTTSCLKFDPDSNIIFTVGTTTTATTLDWRGTSGHNISIQSTSAIAASTISVASGVISADYLTLKNSTATGGATFYAGSHSTNVSGNTGWTFSDAPPITQTETGVARITATTLKTETGTARVTSIVQKTETGTARIAATTRQNISGTARITSGVTGPEGNNPYILSTTPDSVAELGTTPISTLTSLSSSTVML